MGKKVKKAVKSVTKSVKKVVKGAGKVVGGVVGGIAGGGKAPKTPSMPDPIPAAAQVDAAQIDNPESDKDGDSESKRKKAQSGGKNRLTVARSSGRGLNI